MRGRPLVSMGVNPPQYGGPSRAWEPLPKQPRPQVDTRATHATEDRPSIRDGGQASSTSEEAIESRGDRGKGPCYSCGQMGHFRHDCPVMECDLVGGGPQKFPEKAIRHPPLVVKVGLGAREVKALLDSGSAISMIQAHLVPVDRPPLSWTSVVCLHRHTRRLPMVAVRLRYAGVVHEVEVVKMEDLPFPLLLGRDAPAFHRLLVRALQGDPMLVLPVEEEDPGEGPLGAGAAEDEDGTEGDPPYDPAPPPVFPADATFQREQDQESSLRWLRDEVAVEDGQVSNPR